MSNIKRLNDFWQLFTSFILFWNESQILPYTYYISNHNKTYLFDCSLTDLNFQVSPEDPNPSLTDTTEGNEDHHNDEYQFQRGNPFNIEEKYLFNQNPKYKADKSVNLEK